MIHVNVCEFCKTWSTNGIKYCSECGNEVVHYLPCNHFIYVNHKYCIMCGKEVPNWIRNIFKEQKESYF